MKAQNKKTTKRTAKSGSRNRSLFSREGGYSTREDLKSAALLVSVTINVGLFVGWLTLQATNVYDVQVAQFLFT